MRTTIDETGRLLIPVEVRREAGLQPGIPLDVSWHDGHIEIAPVSSAVRLVRRGRFLVAVTEMASEPITAETVEEIRQTVQQEREEAVWR